MKSITIFLPFIAIIVTLFGVLKRKQFFFLLGYTLYSLLVICVELISFITSSEFIHFMVAALWFTQFLIVYPNKSNYDGSLLFKSIATKVFLSLFAINIIGIFMVLNNPIFNDICIYYHSILAFFPLLAILLIFTNKLPIQKNK